MKITKYKTDYFCLFPAVFIMLDPFLYGYKSIEFRLFYGIIDITWGYEED